jgi:hypothetical protein
MQRFQLGVYPDEPTTWKLVDEPPNDAARQRVFDIFSLLADADFTLYGAEQSEHDKFPFMRFTDQAQDVFNQWLTEHQQRLPGEDNPLMAEHLGKYRSLMPSLALVFHLLNIAGGTGRGSISKQATTLAAAWCEYLESHARRIYDYGASSDWAAAVILSKRIDRLPNPFTAKDVYDKQWHLLRNRKEVEAACDILSDENWLIESRPLPTGGRPALPRYLVNPAALEQA